jgi:hypothetical protein
MNKILKKKKNTKMRFKVTGCVFGVYGFEKSISQYDLGFEPNYNILCLCRTGSVFTLNAQFVV